ncbi:trypsin-like peptidase domain-containing protein [Streptomyces sp. BA2]|uniref:trypsin-like peptidase domain-containing protein n=1 Tax=Streptomyces sp. BA2 TaxID=436595 RepID=UPI0013240EDB|nr:trypsin-like peptidase domain-containing protein [Streptomyces sp. BA2]MWA13455.1 PDZ domain-containing protein [Streptomyces sp. BA2]
MDEGKPTKAKWWSRPRSASAPDGAGPERGGPDEAIGTTGDVSTGTTGRAEDTSGDFTLAAAAPPGAGPEPTPLGAAPEPTPPGATPGSDAAASAAAAPVPGASASGGVTSVAATEPGVPDLGAADRPRPLHDPDPYSTPPYGEPGPWAPAPPVQHPATTPAHGTQLPAANHSGTPPHGTPPHGTPQPHTAPQPQAQPQPHPHHPQPAAVAPPRQPYDPWNAPLQQSGAVPVDEAKQKKRARRVILVGIAVITLVAGGIGGAIGAYLERNAGVSDIELPQADSQDKVRAKDSVAGIAASSLPGVVTLHVSGDEAQGTGTGFVLDGKGHILTNNHVVEPAGTGGEISVTFSGGETAKAEVIGRDAGYDLAVVKVSGVRGLKPLPLGNSENVQVGDPVVAIGAPFDLANTVTSGIISAKERPITAGGEKGDGSDVSYVDALQTDAPINPGNSGGPLVDSDARVIGINSAIRSADDSSAPGGGQAGSIGLGFAIPINQGKRVAEELINTGKATHPVIGVTLDMEYTGDGARVGEKGKDGGPAVNAGGPGDRAGIEPGDVITEVDGQRIHSGDELIVKIRAHRPKDSLELTVQRAGKDRKVTLVLGASDGS